MSWQRDGGDISANDPVVSTIRNGITSIEEVCRDLLPMCEEGERKTIVEQLNVEMKKLIKSELLYQENARIISSAIEANPIADDASERAIFQALENIKKASLAQAKDFEKTRLKNDAIVRNPRYIEYTQLLNEVLNENGNSDNDSVQEEADEDDNDADDIEMDVENDDEDVETVGDAIPTIDPVTKKPLKDPVRNIRCQHIYGKQAMLEMIKNNPRSRCPMGGCNNPDFIRPQHLVSDPDLTRRVLLKQKQEKQRRN